MHHGDVEDETLYSFGIFYYFRLKNLLLHGQRGEKKAQKHIIDLTFQKFPHLKSFMTIFNPHKTGRFVVLLVILRKWKHFDGLQIHL